MFGINATLKVVVAKDAKHASMLGYNKLEQYKDAKPLNISDVVVVREGMQSGKPSVDIVLVDEHGNKYVTMLSGALLLSIPCKE